MGAKKHPNIMFLGLHLVGMTAMPASQMSQDNPSAQRDLP
jgi:hypothetical protein